MSVATSVKTVVSSPITRSVYSSSTGSTKEPIPTGAITSNGNYVVSNGAYVTSAGA